MRVDHGGGLDQGIRQLELDEFMEVDLLIDLKCTLGLK